MTIETKDQRRIRLIEQYSLIRYAQENVYDLESVTCDGEHVADKLISKYPTGASEKKPRQCGPYDPRPYGVYDLCRELFRLCDAAREMIARREVSFWEREIQQWDKELEAARERYRAKDFVGES